MKTIHSRHFPIYLLFCLSLVLYFNTAWNDYAIDDAIVLSQNNFTKKGFDGIKDILTHDTFEGFFGKRGSSLIQGGRYRPFSLITFAIEYQCWQLNPGISHLVNALLFALTVVAIFLTLSAMAGPVISAGSAQPFYLEWPFLATLFYAFHPIHTEAIANIKGRDEILAMLFSVGSLYFALQFVQRQKPVSAMGAGVLFFLALLSKENAITFIAIVPLTFYFFTSASKRDYLVICSLFVALAGTFLFIRGIYSPNGLLKESQEILNNPFAYANFQQRYGTIIATLNAYLLLLFFPWTLTHDYYYNQIPYSTFTSIGTISAIVIHLALLTYALLHFKKKDMISFGLLYYFVTFSIVSNLLFSVGIIMNERFLFMPSLGFCIVIAILLQRAMAKQLLSAQQVKIILIVVLAFWGTKTFARNFAWKNNLTLLETDVVSSPHSSKAHTTYGGLLMEETDKIKDSTKIKAMLTESILQLNQAIEIYPQNGDAWLLLGNVYYKLNKDYAHAAVCYANANKFKGGNFDALYNCGIVQLEGNMNEEAISNLKKANMVSPNQFKVLVNIGEGYFKTNKADSAIFWYNKAYAQNPNDAYVIHKIGITYGKLLNNLNEALPWLNKAVELTPSSIVYLEDLAVANGIKGNFNAAIEAANKIIQLNPSYVSAYAILSTSYANIGEKEKAAAMMQKARELSASGARRN